MLYGIMNQKGGIIKLRYQPGPHTKALEWAKGHESIGRYHYIMEISPNHDMFEVFWQFEKEEDAILFALKFVGSKY